MYSFLVLGLIPGTDIQITFTMVGWVIVAALAVVAFRLFMKARRVAADAPTTEVITPKA